MGFFMRLQGDQSTGAGHAGLMDMLNDIFAPGKEHLKEQQQYDEKVGRKINTQSGKPLNFSDNEITVVVPNTNETAPSPKKTSRNRPHRSKG